MAQCSISNPPIRPSRSLKLHLEKWMLRTKNLKPQKAPNQTLILTKMEIGSTESLTRSMRITSNGRRTMMQSNEQKGHESRKRQMILKAFLARRLKMRLMTAPMLGWYCRCAQLLLQMACQIELPCSLIRTFFKTWASPMRLEMTTVR